jgi:curved DNA-binding protein CbpA
MMHLSLEYWGFLLLVCCFCILPSLHGFGAPGRTVVTPHLWAVSPSSSDGNLNGNKQEQTLYTLLGASPTATKEALKARYIALVKTLHPDARVGQDDDDDDLVEDSYADLSDINAAWQVLSDPKGRLRYDRTLKAKQVTEDLERFVEVGFKAAIPFLRKTADTTVAAAKTSSKVINKGAAKAKRAMEVFDVNESIRQLEQRAAVDFKKAQKLQELAKKLPETKLPILIDSSNNANKLTSTEAMRIMKSFSSLNTLNLVEADIATLEEVERLQKESTRTLETKEKATKLAQRQVEQAARVEEMGQQRLKEAQRALEQAQQNHQMTQQACMNAIQETTLATTETNKLEQSVLKASTKVRLGLVKMQDKYLTLEAQRLVVESQRLEELATTFKAQAKQLQEEANKLEQEN